MQPTALLSSLEIHPSAAALPMPAKDDPVYLRVLAGIQDLGRVTDPLKVCKGCVVDGRVRMRGAKLAGLLEVPIEEVPEEEVNGLIYHSLMARRHYTKSGLALLAAMMMSFEVEQEIQSRRVANLRPGAAHREARKLSGWDGRTVEKRLEALAEVLGVSRRRFCAARAILKKLDHHLVSAEERDKWIGKILSGDASLEQVQQGLSGKISALEGKTTPATRGQLTFDFAAVASIWTGNIAAETEPAEERRARKLFNKAFLPSLAPAYLEDTVVFLKAKGLV